VIGGDGDINIGMLIASVGGTMISGGGCGVFAAHVAVLCLEMGLKGDPCLALDCHVLPVVSREV
jgi:hypothetical protein